MKREVNLFAVGGIILLVILLVVAAVSLTRCDNAPAPTEPTVAEPTEAETQPTETEEPTEPPHVHEYTETVTDPDCISDGYTTFDCACGDSYIGNETDALGHTWVDATCTEPKTCSVCSVTEGRANGHSWDDGKVSKEATETEDGKMLFTCTVCGATKTQAIPSPGHSHNYEETVEVTPPTCTEEGFTTHTCRCGDSIVDTKVDALGHTWNDATCTTPKVCSVCGATEGKALGHVWIDATCTEPKTCDRCDTTIGGPLGHAETTVKGYAETCTETGLTDGIQCSVCKTWIKEKDVIPAKGHKEKTVKGKDPTCTETGLTDGIQCSVCNVWIKEQEVIPAKGHSEEIIKGYDSTCTETGLTDGVQCTRCKVWIEKQEVIEKKTHTEKTVKGYEATCTKTGLTDGIQCSVCNVWIKEQEVIPAKGHSEEIIKGYDSTCTATGLTDGKKCTVCGTITLQQESIPALGHKDFNWVVKQKETCTVDGYKDRTCSRCGLYEKEILKAPGHKEETIKGYAATCDKDGLTDGKKCTICGIATLEQETVPALGHSYGTGIVTYPDIRQKEYITYMCTRCNYSYKEYVSYADGTLVFNLDGVARLYLSDSKVKETYSGWLTKTYSWNYIPWSNNTYHIEHIIIENGVSPVSTNYWFSNCLNLKSVSIPSSVTNIGIDAFRKCSSLTSIILPTGVTTIDSGAFDECINLSYVVIPDSVTYIGSYAFGYCSSLRSISIPKSTTKIDVDAFRYCTNLVSLVVASGNPVYHSSGNCLIITASKGLIHGCNNSTIPSDGSVEDIWACAFDGCSGLTSIYIPNSVTYIGLWAFRGCTSLNSVNYLGSISQWNSVSKSSGWNESIPAREVVCLDGTVPLN